MRLADLFEAQVPRSFQKLVAKHRKTFDLLPFQAQYRFKNTEYFVRAMAEADPVGKYTDWLCLSYANGPWTHNDTNDIKRLLLRFDRRAGRGQIKTFDIYQWHSIIELEEAMKRVPEKEQSNGPIKIEVQDYRLGTPRVKLFKGTKEIGSFQIDLAMRHRGVATMHSSIIPSYRGQGLGTQVYDFVQKFVKEKYGLRLMPSSHLTNYSYNFWMKRMPEFMRAHYEPSDETNRFYVLIDYDAYGPMQQEDRDTIGHDAFGPIRSTSASPPSEASSALSASRPH